jgi:hypothetical protein
MLAYKALRARAVAPITGMPWPRPEGGVPAAWVEAHGPLVPCRNGVHATPLATLPHWLSAELWLVELEGEVVDGPEQLVARRGRLLAPVEAWPSGGSAAFSADCVRRASELVGSVDRTLPRAAARAADAAPFADQPGVVAYVTAVVAGEVAGRGRARGPTFDAAFLAERARQAAWLRDHLGLRDRLERSDVTALGTHAGFGTPR